jgi:hypothetical protein
MNPPIPARVPRAARRAEAGFALPLALVGLVVITLLVTTTILTSSTELALSHAHRDASRGLYTADAALEGFVARVAQDGGPPPLGEYTFLPADGTFTPGCSAATQGDDRSCIELSSLFYQFVPPVDGGQVSDRQIWSMVARPHNERGWGRRVGMLVESLRSTAGLNTDINAGASFSGAEVNVTGNSLVSGVQDAAYCDDTHVANAVTVTAGTTTNIRARNVEGKVDTVAVGGTDQPETLDQMVFGGMSMEDLTKYATHAYGPGFADHPAYRGAWPGVRTSSLESPTIPRATSDQRNWGCPGPIDTANLCGNYGGDTTYFPIVVVDAGGGTVHHVGDHGQGWFIVINGNLLIDGNFIYRGVIAVEGGLDIRGKGGDTKVEGAVVATGRVNLEYEDDHEISGSAVIRYNSCAIAAAENALNAGLLNLVPQVFSQRPYGWFEAFR